MLTFFLPGCALASYGTNCTLNAASTCTQGYIGDHSCCGKLPPTPWLNLTCVPDITTDGTTGILQFEACEPDDCGTLGARREIFQDVRDYLLGVEIESVVPFRSGNVSSPNYPNNYPDGLEKTELIQVEQGKVLSLEFTAFDIDFDPVLCDLNCNCDHVTIKDGDGTTLMGKTCGSSLNGTAIFEGRLIGSSLPPVIVSRTNSIGIFFKTGSLAAKSGWSANWKAEAPGTNT